MLLKKPDIIEFKKMFEDFRQVAEEARHAADFGTHENFMRTYLWNIDYFYNNLHFLFSAGFDEVRYIKGKDRFLSFLSEPDLNTEYCWLDEYALFREEETGVWYWLHEAPFMGGEFRLARVGNSGLVLNIPVDRLLQKAEKAAEHHNHSESSVVSPLLWTPDAQRLETSYLQHATLGILSELKSERVSLSGLHWRQLEELVAELLRGQGFEVHRVIERPQGGRDLIVRGQFIPGEMSYMAVEVKHRPVVGVGEVRSALKASEYYPALLIATSGRFTAGVIKEKQKATNQLRLLLKDGTALSEMIRTHKIASST